MAPGPAWPRTAHSLLARLPVRGRAALARLAVHAPHLSGARGHRCPRPDPRGHVRAGAPAAGGFSPRCPPRAVPGSAPPPPRVPAALKVAMAGARVGPPTARWERARAEPAGAALPTNKLRTNKYRLQYLPQRYSSPGRASAVAIHVIGKLRQGDGRELQAYLGCRARLPVVQIWGGWGWECVYLCFDSGIALGSWLTGYAPMTFYSQDTHCEPTQRCWL